MANLTRILNNQIYSKTIIASQKIADGTITGSLFSSNVTVPGDFLITGNLFVLGTSAYTTVASTNTYVNDPLIVLNNGFGGTNTYDEGFIFNRGSLQNRALIWSEFYQEFRLIGTTETGTAYGNVAVSSYQNLHVGNLTVDYTANVTNLNATGFINTSANVSAAVGVFGGVNTTGYINAGGNVSTPQLNAGQINTTGNVLSTGGVFNALTVNGNETITGYLNVAGNVLASAATFNSSQINGNQSVTGYLNVTGNILATTGKLSTLVLNSTTNATDTTSGALQIAGGVGISKDVWIGGNLYVSNIFATSYNILTVNDPLLYLTAANTYPYTYDIGFYSQFVGGAGNIYQHSGFVRDHNDAYWKAFSNVVTEPTGTITFDGDTIYDGIKAGNLVLTETGRAITAVGFINTSGNVSAATVIAGQFNTTGNLVASQVSTGTLNATGLINTLANISASRINADTLAATGTIWANATTDTTSLSTGALIVAGGAAVGKDLYVGKGATFNSTNSINPFQVKSSTSGNIAIFANVATTFAAASESVIIGGGNLTIQPGATLKVNSITAMMLPVGPTAGRPGSLLGSSAYDVAGMIRFNSTSNAVEFYDGSAWTNAGSTFTVISDRQFSGNVAGGYGNVDGTNTDFTLQSSATTAATIVSINGVMQFPTLAYSVSGTTLTFTEPPAPGDVIDARILTTTSTVTSIASASGLSQFIATDAALQFWTGTGATTLRANIDQSGNFNFLTGNKVSYDQTATAVNNTNLTLLDSFSANAYTSAKYIISIKQGTGNVQAMEALLTQSTVGSTAGTAYLTTYGVVNTGNTMGTLAANVDVSGSWTVKMYLIPNAGTAISNVKVMTTYIV